MHETLKKFWKDNETNYLLQPITLWFGEQSGDYRAEDAGIKGFIFENHIGIQNVRERLQKLCGGTMTIESEEGRGTCITIRIPLGKERP